QPEEALSRFMKIYGRRLMDYTIPYDGVVESLSIAMRRGPLAVLTNKPLGPSIGLLEALGMRGFFSRIIGGDSEYGRKPDPKGLLSLHALAPGEPLVMVGDSPADWKTAEAAGIPFVFARDARAGRRRWESDRRADRIPDGQASRRSARSIYRRRRVPSAPHRRGPRPNSCA